MKESEGGDIVTWGSRTLWTGLLAHGLVDELHLVVGNGIVGAGVPLFKNVAGITALPAGEPRLLLSSPNVVLKYAVRS